MDILVVGLNQALQKSLIFNNLNLGEINRTDTVSMAVGGKGANFSRAALTWQSRVKLFQFAGGDTGRLICELLDAENIPHHTVAVDGATRTCTTCLCRKTGSMTELIEPSGFVDPKYRQQLMNEIRDQLPSASSIALCGTFPPGVDGSFYAEVAHHARTAGIPVMLDAWQQVEEVLDVGVNILKINCDELRELTAKENLSAGIDAIFNQYDIETLALTDGPRQAFLAQKSGEQWVFQIPELEQVANPLGAGDTTSAVTLSEFIKGTSISDAFAMGLAAASASCRSLKVADFSKTNALELRKKLTYHQTN